MGMLTFPEFLGLLMVSLSASLIVIWVLGKLRSTSEPFVAETFVGTNKDVFLFEKDILIDHDVNPPPPSWQNIDMLADWSDLRNWFGLRFSDLPASLANLEEGTCVFDDLLDRASGLQLKLTRHGQTTRVELLNESSVSPANWHCTNLQINLARDATEVLDRTPFPIWKTDENDKVTWRNPAFEKIVLESGQMPEIVKDSRRKDRPERFSAPARHGKEAKWFEVNTHPLNDSNTLHVATAIDQVIKAETAQRAFVQTLTKTFATLTTGLAVFDKNHQLALFNPALVDLTGISVSFLSARPDVIRFFDELRERQVLPEPKNYATLRSKIREVIARAHDGSYLEMWNLPGGETYRITGRPHPDGAVAFLIEDISAEVIKTRQFRSQIDLGQSVIDALNEAIVVIAPNDTVLFCNTACTDMLKIDPAVSFSDLSVDDLINACRDQFQSNALWSIFEANVRNDVGRLDTTSRFLNHRSGIRMQYQIKALTGGIRMINFSQLALSTSKISSTAAE